jgi:hypothetical protein
MQTFPLNKLNSKKNMLFFNNQRMTSNTYIPSQFANRLPQSVNNIAIPQNFPNQNVISDVNLGTYRKNLPQKENAPLPSAANGPLTGRAKWGPPIWTLFHTLAEKIKPEYFSAIRTDLLNVIYSICTNLPCPECAKHAMQHLNSLNFNTISTKDDLKNMLFRFHNSVNLRKGTAVFDYSELSSKYSTMNTSMVIYKFMEVFATKNYNVQLISNDFHKNRAVAHMQKWFAQNIQCFEP